MSHRTWVALGKITFQGRPKDVPEKRPDVFRTSPYDSICNAKGRIRNGTPLRRTQDVNLTLIHKWVFMEFFLFFLIPIAYQKLYC